MGSEAGAAIKLGKVPAQKQRRAVKVSPRDLRAAAARDQVLAMLDCRDMCTRAARLVDQAGLVVVVVEEEV